MAISRNGIGINKWVMMEEPDIGVDDPTADSYTLPTWPAQNLSRADRKKARA